MQISSKFKIGTPEAKISGKTSKKTIDLPLPIIEGRPEPAIDQPAIPDVHSEKFEPYKVQDNSDLIEKPEEYDDSNTGIDVTHQSKKLNEIIAPNQKNPKDPKSQETG